MNFKKSQNRVKIKKFEEISIKMEKKQFNFPIEKKIEKKVKKFPKNFKKLKKV